MEVIFPVAGLYCIVRGFGAYNQHDDPSRRSFRGDHAIENGRAGCFWWIIAVMRIVVGIACREMPQQRSAPTKPQDRRSTGAKRLLVLTGGHPRPIVRS